MATARQDIQLGVEPKGVGGHNNRQAHVICNAQFTELYKAMGAVFGGVNSGAEGAVLPQFLPITNGGTGGGTVEEARANLGVYSKTQVDNLIANEGATAIENGGTGGTTVEEARLNLNVYSKEEVDTAISNISITEAISIEQGGTGAETAGDARTNLDVYSKAEVDTAISSSVPVVVDATTTYKGVVELATQTEVNTGTDAVRAVTPQTMLSGVKNHLNASGSAPLFACRAWVNFNGVPLNGTYSQSGTTVTVTMTAHGMRVGQTVDLAITSGTAVSGRYTVATVADANTFTYTAGTSLTTSGNVTRNNFIRASGNVLGITDNGVGNYTINFLTAMQDANFACATSGWDGTVPNPTYASRVIFEADKTTSSVRIYTVAQGSGGSMTDFPYISATIFR